MSNLLDQIGGTSVINRIITEFYQALGRHLSTYEACDHRKQQARQVRFISNALADSPEPVRSSRARFLARGLNGPLFEALLEYLQPRLVELGIPQSTSSDLVETTEGLYDHCDAGLSLAC
ncbi:hypothetical protein [Microbulbifer sediminum]|uniref:hypothetical protein n=1 Tax=Microbulbifer sediminum TaxID=2904250 RepID=UPI001F2F6359|nr:hypothetical protein [Microbulbifer sediminum]